MWNQFWAYLKFQKLPFVLEVERAENSAGSSEPSWILMKNFRARASRAKTWSKISELERAEPKLHQKFPSLSEPSFGSSRRAKKRAGLTLIFLRNEPVKPNLSEP